MYNFDEIIDRSVDKCRKWDYDYVCSRFGAVPKDFIPMWIADMDFKSPPEVIAGLRQIVEHGTFGYTYCFDEFYQAVINFQAKQHNADIAREWITLTYGTVSTLHYTIQAFCNAGDAILMNTPVYDPFELAAERQKVRVIANPLVAVNQRYQLDFEKLEQQIKEHQPKLYLFCSPHNPSGRIWTAAEIRRVSELCQKYQVILVIDEVHAEHILHGTFINALNEGCAHADNLILLTSPNKAFNLGGLKTSYSIIPNEQLRARFRQQLEKNSITSPNMFGVWGLIYAYTQGLDWLKALNTYLAENERYLYEFISERLPTLKMMRTESSYLAWIDVSATGMNAYDFTHQLAHETGVVVEDGTHYVQNGEHYIRINFGTPKALIEQAMARLEDFVQRHSA
ncbi:MAG: PatB family C-S lyase [Hafnia alvei]|uniref:MalY/PatB family protein n=1 Tax=Hafnia alvei TaxID=569 RepID=UPI0028BDBE71|nr:PatB family C-S lyase [Hafnia alvei]MDU7483062.1 PatB family C-S lyase [Hafnia alvei]WNN53301.1 PatB family C-S lyase [Hafnia alvei]